MTANIYWQGFHLPMQVASEEISSTAGNYVDCPPSRDLHQDLSNHFTFYNMKGDRILEGQTQFVIFRMIRSLYCHHLSLLPTFTFTYDWKIFSTTWEAKDYCIWSLRDRKEKLFVWILFRSRTSTIIMMHRQIRFDCIMSSLTMSLLLFSIFSE